MTDETETFQAKDDPGRWIPLLIRPDPDPSASSSRVRIDLDETSKSNEVGAMSTAPT